MKLPDHILVALDCNLFHINALFITSGNKTIDMDGKIGVDDHAQI
jgi:succinyl-CoA synthetase beta subunit